MSVLPSAFLSSVVAIGIEKENAPEEKLWIGTGFIVRRPDNADPKQGTFYVVTCKNILGQHKRIFLRFNSIGGKLVKDYAFDMKSAGEQLYSVHPDEKSDIAAFSFLPECLTEKKTVWSAIDLGKDALTLEQMHKAGVEEGSLVHALEYPVNLVSPLRMPVVRLGCVARITDAYLARKNLPPYLADIFTVPGGTGAPLVTRPEISMTEELFPVSPAGTGQAPAALSAAPSESNAESLQVSTSDKTAAGKAEKAEKAATSGVMQKKVTFKHSQSRLIGMLCNAVLYNDVSIDAASKKPITFTRANSGLTIVQPVDKIKEVVDIEWSRVEISKMKPRPNLHIV